MLSKITKYSISFSLLLVSYILVSALYFEKFFKAEHGYSFFFGKRPLISVLVTSYNYEKYLPETLDSILAQTYKKYEVIIVDDGSKDNSVELIKKYTAKYPNFYLYQHKNGENRGLPASVKLGVEKAKGEYIAFLESDDLWHKNKLLEVVKIINKYPNVVIIANNVTPFGDDVESVQQALIYPDFINKKLQEKNFLENNIDLYSVISTMSAVTIKKEVLITLNFDTPMPALLDVWLYKQLLGVFPLYYISERLTLWRRHKHSFNNPKKQEQNKINIEIFFNELKKVIEK